MKVLVLVALLSIGVVSTISGCSSIPANVATDIALLCSNTVILDSLYRRSLAPDATPVTTAQARHDRALMDAQDSLAVEVSKWAAAHKAGN